MLLQQISMQWFTHKGRIHMDGLHSKYKYAERPEENSYKTACILSFTQADINVSVSMHIHFK